MQMHKKNRQTQPQPSRVKPALPIDVEDDYDEAEESTSQPIVGDKDRHEKATSLEDYFRVAIDKTPSSGDADNVPAGNYEAIVTSIVKQDFDLAKGQSVRMKFRLCGSENEGATATTWFKILDANKRPVEFTIGKFKGVLAKLGYELTYEEMDSIFEEIEEAQPGVILKIGYQIVLGNRYQRVDVVDACDNDVVQEYKDRVRV